MQLIELNCFQNSEDCFYISDLRNFKIKNEDENYQLKINNFSKQECDLSLSLVTATEFLHNLELIIFSGNELFFKDNLGETSKNSINLAKISEKSSKIYDFDFKFTEKEAVLLNFDLILSFSCKIVPNLESVSKIASNSAKVAEKSTGEVLGQKTIVSQKKLPEENLVKIRKQDFIPYLILLVVLIFVIMFFVNGKKKKKKKF